MLEKGFGMIPNIILNNQDISPRAKLLFCHISSLCAQKGYAWANNEHLGKLVGVSESQVSRLMGSLEPYIEVINGVNFRRKIYLRKNTELPTQKAQGYLRKNAAHNNIKEEDKLNSIALDQRLAIYTLYLKCFKVQKYSYITISADEVKNVDLNYLMDKAAKRYKLTPKRAAIIDRRIKDAGYNMVCAAIVGYSKDDFYTGGGNRGWFADLEFICRSYENVEKGAGLYEQHKSGKMQDDDWKNLR